MAGDLDDVDGRQLRGDLRPFLFDLEAEGGDFLLPRRIIALLEPSICSLSSTMGFSRL